MALPNETNRQKGHYLGTEIDEKWWRRYRQNKFFARGNGEYWVTDDAICFRRYLTRQPLLIPFEKIIDIKIGKSHAGRWVFGLRALKVVWKNDGLWLSSGFVVSKDQAGTEAMMKALKRRYSHV